MAMQVKEVADLAGISIRTLHYYDKIGLLTPDSISETGYRLYSTKNLDTLQQILFFKELGFALGKIKEILENPLFDRKRALVHHREMLLKKRARLNRILETIDKTIQHMNGEIELTNEEKFKGFDFTYNPYEEEARKLWGDEPVDRSNTKISGISEDKQKILADKMEFIYKRLASIRHLQPESEEAQGAIEAWYDFLNDNFGTYSPEMFKALGQMYVDDKRFTKSIDRFGDGLATFMRDAMSVFTDKANS